MENTKNENKIEEHFLEVLEHIKKGITDQLDDINIEHKPGEIFSYIIMVNNVLELSTVLTLLNNFNYREFTPKILNLESVMNIMKEMKSGQSAVLKIHFILREGNKHED